MCPELDDPGADSRLLQLSMYVADFCGVGGTAGYVIPSSSRC